MHGLYVAGGRGEEHLARIGDDLDRLVDLAAAVPLEDQPARDAGEATAGQRRGAQVAVDDVEDVRAGALAQVAGEVGEDRLGGAAPLRFGKRHDVLGVRRGLEPRQRTPFVAGPGHRGHRGRLRERAQWCRDHDERRRLVAAPGAEWCRPAGVRDPNPAERQVLVADHRLDATAYGLLVDRW